MKWCRYALSFVFAMVFCGKRVTYCQPHTTHGRRFSRMMMDYLRHRNRTDQMMCRMLQLFLSGKPNNLTHRHQCFLHIIY